MWGMSTSPGRCKDVWEPVLDLVLLNFSGSFSCFSCFSSTWWQFPTVPNSSLRFQCTVLQIRPGRIWNGLEHEQYITYITISKNDDRLASKIISLESIWNPYGIQWTHSQDLCLRPGWFHLTAIRATLFSSSPLSTDPWGTLKCLRTCWVPEGKNMKKHQLILKKRENVTTWPPPKNWQNDKLAQFTPTHFGINSGSTDSPECSPTSSWYAARSSLCSTSSRFGQHDTWHCSM